MSDWLHIIKEHIRIALAPEFDVPAGDISFTIPPERKFGDLSTNIAFQLAKKTGQKPFAIGNRMAALLQGKIALCADIRLAGGGFLNFYLRHDLVLQELAAAATAQPAAAKARVIVEHTSINPNKAAHIGHLRNSCLGDTLVRAMQFLGFDVEIQNYIDDTGIQVADVVWGLMYRLHKNLVEIEAIPDLAAFLWTFYSDMHQVLDSDDALQKERNEVHRKIEHKIEPEYSVCKYVAREVLRDHIRVMERLGIRYDMLINESDVIELGFFQDAAEMLKAKQVMTLASDPEKKGCWVIHYQKEKIDKIIIRSNGTTTYVGKDIAYNMWKFGLIGRDFYYRDFFSYRDGKTILMSSSTPGSPAYTHTPALRVYNVIDVRQSYLQSLIGQAIGQLGFAEQSQNFTHFSYEMVALTPRCVEELGFALSPEQRAKPYVEVSGRKGIAVKASDLLDTLEKKSLAEVQQRHPELPATEAAAIARAIAVGALRYFMIKFTLNAVIAFDFKDALNFEGDTGPYLQYTIVRLNSILRKLHEQGARSAIAPVTAELGDAEQQLYWEIALHLAWTEQAVAVAIQNNEPAAIAQFTYNLCQKFNHYYHLYPIIAETNLSVRQMRLNLVLHFKRHAEQLLSILGIAIPEKM